MSGPPATTADLCDSETDAITLCESPLKQFGGVRSFAGAAVTIFSPEDNVLLSRVIEEDGDGRVIVVDGAAARSCALLGDRMAAIAIAHGWKGIIINGAVRDSALLAGMDIGVKALAANPRRSGKQGVGERDVAVTFGGVTFIPGSYVVSDDDGVIVLPVRPAP